MCCALRHSRTPTHPAVSSCSAFFLALGEEQKTLLLSSPAPTRRRDDTPPLSVAHQPFHQTTRNPLPSAARRRRAKSHPPREETFPKQQIAFDTTTPSWSSTHTTLQSGPRGTFCIFSFVRARARCASPPAQTTHRSRTSPPPDAPFRPSYQRGGRTVHAPRSCRYLRTVVTPSRWRSLGSHKRLASPACRRCACAQWWQPRPPARRARSARGLRRAALRRGSIWSAPTLSRYWRCIACYHFSLFSVEQGLRSRVQGAGRRIACSPPQNCIASQACTGGQTI